MARNLYAELCQIWTRKNRGHLSLLRLLPSRLQQPHVSNSTNSAENSQPGAVTRFISIIARYCKDLTKEL